MATARRKTTRKTTSRARKTSATRRRVSGTKSSSRVSGLKKYQSAKKKATRSVDQKIADTARKLKQLKAEKVKKVKDFNRKYKKAA